jgi:hypothetical protein
VKSIILLSFLLCGCHTYTKYHGHHGINKDKIKKSFKETKKENSKPITLPFKNDIAYYISMNFNMNGFGSFAILPSKIIRLELEEDSVNKINEFEFEYIVPNRTKTKVKHISRNIFKEMFADIGSIKAPDGLKV